MSWFFNGCLSVKNIAILIVNGTDFRCILWGISKDEAVNKLNNSLLEDKGFLSNGVWCK